MYIYGIGNLVMLFVEPYNLIFKVNRVEKITLYV